MMNSRNALRAQSKNALYEELSQQSSPQSAPFDCGGQLLGNSVLASTAASAQGALRKIFRLLH
ncbi:MAG: hypothetical protein HC853_07135 [Anaerolineae bacterium]|nr:hypothetical protein [Anaerolineae bacterium]